MVLPLLHGASGIMNGMPRTEMIAAQAVCASPVPLRLSVGGRRNVVYGTDALAISAPVAGIGGVKTLVAGQKCVEQRAQHIALEARDGTAYHPSQPARSAMDVSGNFRNAFVGRF